MRDNRRAPDWLRGRNGQHERGRRDSRQTEGLRGRGQIDLRLERAPGLFAVIRDRTRAGRDERRVAGQVRVERSTAVMPRFLVVEMDVRQRRGNDAELHEDDKRGGRQPSKHTRIVTMTRSDGT